MTDEVGKAGLLAITAKITVAHLGNNAVATADISRLINEIYKSLASTGAGNPPTKALEPAVPIKKSITPDFIICLEDGKKLKMLKRHLMAAYKLTPSEYRGRWGLPVDYPMVAPKYAKRHSELAKHIGLGTKRIRRRGVKK